MPGDFSRRIFDSSKNYDGVLMQQGRVQLDADWNEQFDIQQHRLRTQTKDVIGLTGVPKKGNGFNITAGSTASDFIISEGSIYVEGILCEFKKGSSDVTYLHQPWYPEPDLSNFTSEQPAVLNDGVYLIYLDVWQQEITFLDDPRIQEIALGEADTTARLKTYWQVKLLKLNVEDPASLSCKGPHKEWDDLIASSTGTLNVKTEFDESKNPCILPSLAGYRRLENQLYRVEIQNGGDHNKATFKWSRDNATVETLIESIDGSVIAVADVGRDEFLGFAPQQWVQIIDEASTLKSTPYPLVKITSVDPDTREITVNDTVNQYKNNKKLKLRRWDQSGTTAAADGIAVATGWLELEDGIKIQFSVGSYKSGDFWLIPARTATAEVEWPPFEVPNINPAPQAPFGTSRHYAKLALLQSLSGYPSITDCRNLFPSLTDICAEDICYDNTNCDIPNATTVQDALDALCAANDLRLHNKLLHGYGVVCGMKVKCGPERIRVLIENGYALDCDGNLIQLNNKTDLVFDLVNESATLNLLDATGSGKVVISISNNGISSPILAVEKYQSKSFWEEVLEGSLLMDFFNDTIFDLYTLFTTYFPSKLDDTAPVPTPQRRLTAFINLFAQLVNSASGPYVFISGSQKGQRSEVDCGPNSDEHKSEDQLIWCFYNALKKEIASETFCAMFDQDRDYPTYDIDPGLSTVFGPAIKFHDKLRIHPNGNFAYTSGMNNKIYVYNLATEEYIESSTFPSAEKLHIQDIIVSAKEDELYALAVMNNKHSIFAMASIDEGTGTIKWKETSVVCDIIFATLGLSPNNDLYAVGKSKGIYRIKNIGQQSFAIDLVAAFNATGLMKIHGKFAYAAGDTSSSMVSSNFNQIGKYDITINNPSQTPIVFVIEGSNLSNDICIHNHTIYITGSASPSSPRALFAFTESDTQVFAPISINTDSVVRLAALDSEIHGRYLLLTLSDSYKVVRIDLKMQALDKLFRIPVQLFPVGIAVDPKARKAYVLNTFVNTLTSIEIDKSFDTSSPPNYTFEPPEDLAIYRDDVVDAFSDLMKHLLQYLKDAFCDKFLIDCPECGPEDKVYLAEVEIRERKVYHICNFTKRKYVKSFPTYSYWLSTVPVLPALKQVFEKFCCFVVDTKSKKP